MARQVADSQTVEMTDGPGIRTASRSERPDIHGGVDLENGTHHVEQRVAPGRRVQRVIREILREHYLCLVLVWLLLVLALAIATFVTFIEMLIVFRKHNGDKCDVPLDLFVWVNIVTFVYHNTLHLCIQRWLGYDPAMYNTDEPVPEVVARYEAFVQFWSFLLCIAGVILVSEAETCPETAPELFRAVARFVWTGFVLAIACIITSLSTAIFVMLMRRGALNTSDAAPAGTLELCRVVKPGEKEDDALLSPDEDGEDKTCPICMEAFDSSKEIRQTPCKHLFHGQCLSGWLNVSRCCPMCRHDFTVPFPSMETQDRTSQQHHHHHHHHDSGGEEPEEGRAPPLTRSEDGPSEAASGAVPRTSSPLVPSGPGVVETAASSVSGGDRAHSSPHNHGFFESGDSGGGEGIDQSTGVSEFTRSVHGCGVGSGPVDHAAVGGGSGASTPDEGDSDPSVRSLLGSDRK